MTDSVEPPPTPATTGESPRSRATAWAAGSSLAHYRIERELGRGGQGVVLLAEDLKLRRRVALKVLTALGPGSESSVRRFRREAEVASRLDHPGICGVHDAGVVGGVPYIAMHYVEGRTLAEEIAAARATTVHDRPSTVVDLSSDAGTAPADPAPSAPAPTPAASRRSLDEILVLFERTARALHAAHEAGIVHRDVKPGNVMITKGGEPVVLDFGLAHAEDLDGQTLTKTGDLFGTPAYMSPEQLTGRRIRLDRRTDVYSLGVSLYERLTLRRPFEAPTRQALYQAVLTKAPPDPRRLDPRIGVDLKVVLETALEKDRDRRYQTAADLAEDLRRVRAREPILARPVGPVGRLLRWTRREPAKAALLGVVVVTLPVIAALVTAHVKDRPALEAARAAAKRDEIEALLAEASWQFSEGSPAEAVRLYDRILAADPTCPEAATGRAMEHLRRREAEAALKLVEAHASSVGDGHATARLRADALQILGRSDAAKAAAAAVPPPTTAVDFAFLAMLALQEGERTRSASAFRLATRYATRAVLLATAPRLDFMVLRAHAAAHARDADACTESAEALLRHWPTSAYANFFAGFALNEAGDPRRAPDVAAAYRETLRLRPDFHAARHNLGNTYAAEGALDRAIATFREVLRATPDDADSHAALGRTLARAGRFDEAGAAFREAARLVPEDPDALMNLALALREAGRTEEALAPLRKARALRPEDADLRGRLGDALLDAGLLDDAAEELRAAVRLKPDLGLAHNLLGVARAQAGDFSAAVEAFRATVRLSPDDPDAHANLGCALIETRSYEEAIAELRTALRLEASRAPSVPSAAASRPSGPPTAERARVELGRVLSLAGRLDEAAEILADQARAAPADAQSQYRYGNALRSAGRPADAVEPLSAATRLDPEFPEARCNLGLTYRRLGRIKDAVASLRVGHALGSQRPGWPYPSAEWLAESERALAAAEAVDPELDRRVAAGTTPDDPSETFRMAKLLFARGRHADALRWFDRAFERLSAPEDDAASRYRFVAACAGLRVAASETDAAAAAALRRRAAERLAADVAECLDADLDRFERNVVLTAYEYEPALDPVRPPRLAVLPAAERAAFEAVWSALARLDRGG